MILSRITWIEDGKKFYNILKEDGKQNYIVEMKDFSIDGFWTNILMTDNLQHARDYVYSLIIA